MTGALTKGMKVRHRASGKSGIVVSVEAGTAKVSFDFGDEQRIDLVALEPCEPDEKQYTAVAPDTF